MARTKRAQVLMEEDDYARLERIARARGVSVGALIREVVEERYLGARGEQRRAIIEEIAGMGLPVIDWADAERMIEDAHGGGLP